MLSNELRDQQEGKATRWAAFFDFQRAVAPCLNGCLFPTALISSCLNCRSLGGAEICPVSKRMFIPDGTPVLVTEYYILTRRNIETLNMVACSATNVESCLCLKARKVWQRGRLRRWGRRRSDAELQRFNVCLSQGGGCFPFPERYRPTSTPPLYGISAASSLFPKECAWILPSMTKGTETHTPMSC